MSEVEQPNPTTGEMPVLFLSHGSPTLPFDDVPARRFLGTLARRLPEPRAILCISAHWEAAAPSITAAAKPATIHDFYGFPKALYELRYDAPGDPALAARLARRLAEAGYAPMPSQDRGLDHGAWSPLLLVYPEAYIPVVQLSLLHRQGTEQHVALGRVLAPLRREGVLIVASGGAVHNLRMLDWRGDSSPPSWALTFDSWLHATIAAGDLDALIAYRKEAPDGALAHPSEDHILPLFVALGAASGEKPLPAGRRLHQSFTLGSLSMASYGWGLDA